MQMVVNVEYKGCDRDSETAKRTGHIETGNVFILAAKIQCDIINRSLPCTIFLS